MAAVPLDFLKQITNVHWGGGGGVFIAGNNDSNIYYLKLDAVADPDNPPAWESLGTLDFTKDEGAYFTGYVQGSTFAMVGAVEDKKPVFILVGGGGPRRAIGIIMASRDGKEWSRVFSYGQDSDTYRGVNIFGVVWDEVAQMFYAGGHQFDSFLDSTILYAWQTEIDLLFASADGFAWSEIGRNERKVEAHGTDPFPPWPDYPSGLLAAHCSKRVLDSNGNGVPGGNYGYDKDKELLIAPNKPVVISYDVGFLQIPTTGSDVTVTFSGEGDPPSYPSNPGLPAICVATAGGKWVVAGGDDGDSQAAIAVASDEAYIWQSLNPEGTSKIITLTAGDLDNAGL